MLSLPSAIAFSVIVVLLAGCATETYQTKPLDPEKIVSSITERDPNSAEFNAYLMKQGYPEADLPLRTWGLHELTLCALFYHSKLDVAKAQYGLALNAINAANQKPAIGFGGHVGRSNRKNNDINPWALGLQVDIPVQTTDKRAIKIEEAHHLAEAARLDIADTAWQLRQAIAADLLQLHQNTVHISQLQNTLETHEKMISILQKRVAAGINSNTDLSNYQLAQQQALFSLTIALAKTTEIEAKLAADCGLSVEKFKLLKIQTFDLDSALKQQKNVLTDAMATKTLQEKTLLNRIDIRRALAKYAAAESKIKLEIAKQTPDISLSPGWLFEFGDTIWSLGINTLLNLAKQNQTMIAEATQLREVEAAQFEALQAQTLANLAQALAQYQAVNAVLLSQQQLVAEQAKQQQKQQKQFEAGLIDRLSLSQSDLNQQLSLQQLRSAQFSVLQAALALENIMQHPIEATSTLPSEIWP